MSSSSKRPLHIQKKRGTAMPRLMMEVLGKPKQTDMGIAAHAYCVRTTMLASSLLVENFLGFHQQDLSITLQKI